MKFMMVFEAVDRATRVMGKIMGAERKTAAAIKAGARAGQSSTEASTRATQRLAAALSRIGGAARSAYAAVVAGANAAQRATVNLHRKTVELGKVGFAAVRQGAARASRGVLLAAGAAASAVGAAALAANQLLRVATSFESYNIQLETLEGSSEKGRKAMAWVSDFAARTPLELDQVVEAYRNLRTFGLDPTDGTLQALVDTMAASGKGAEQLEGLTLALGQAWTKGKLQGEEALQLLERGVPVWDILSQKYGKTAAELQDLASKGKLGREAIRLLIEEIGRRNAGASDKMARTWTGMVSNLSDAWTRFALAIMDAGLFNWMKGKLQMVLDTVNRMAGDGTLQAWAARVSARIIRVLEAAWSFATRTYAILSRLGFYLAVAADTVGGWENLAMILAGLAFASTLIGTAAGLVQIAAGLAMLGAALLANPILLLISAIVAGAVAIHVYWEPIKAFFAGLWTAIAAGAQAAWEGLKAFFAGLWTAIANGAQAAWEGLKAFFAGLWNAIAAGAQAAWGKIKEWLSFDPVAALAAGWHTLSGLLADVWNSLPPLTWDGVLTVLDWGSWLLPLRWLDFVPGLSWSGVISGVLDWGSYITSIDWSAYLPEFSWPELPAFDWPELPTLTLPELPDIAGWIGAFGDKAYDALTAVGARLGDAWSGIKSAFSWGDEDATVTVTDPATIRAAAAATAALKTDMQAVAAIETRPAVDRLAALESAAQRVGAAVTSSIRQAHAFLANVSFYDQGAALMDTLAAGIRARAAIVTAEIARIAQAVRDHLPSSPARVGPLSDIHRLKFTETIAASIRPAPMVRAMRQAAAATLAAATFATPTPPAGLSLPMLPAGFSLPMLPAGFSLPMLPASAAAAPAALLAHGDEDRAVAARAAIARVSVQGRAAEPSAASPVTLHFRPVLNFKGSAPASDVQAEFDRMLRGAGRELGKLLDEETRRRRRSEV